MCCHCAVVLDNLPSHRLYVDGNGWLLDKPIGIERVFEEISANEVNLQEHEIPIHCFCSGEAGLQCFG